MAAPSLKRRRDEARDGQPAPNHGECTDFRSLRVSSSISPPEPAMGLPEQNQPTTRARLESVDAYRGLVMFLMMAEILKFAAVSKALPGNETWAFLAGLQTHVEWIGCSLHDLIQPSF